MAKGTVKWFNPAKGYGFIAPEDGGNDVFIHVTAVKQAGLDSLSENQRLSFDLEEVKNGKTAAVNIKVE